MGTKLKSYGDIIVSNDGCELTLTRRHYGFHIYTLITKKELTNRGHARRLLERVLKYAKKRNRRLTLEYGAFGHRTLPNNQLKAFYERMGFRVKDGSFMEFVP